MGNTQSLTRTGGALDSFIADLGSDLVFEKRCDIYGSPVFLSLMSHSKSWNGAFSEDREMPPPLWICGGEGLHQAGPWPKPKELSSEVERYVSLYTLHWVFLTDPTQLRGML